MADRLDLLVAAGLIDGWEYTGSGPSKRTYALSAGPFGEPALVPVGSYTPDFATWGPLGRCVIEVKGRMARDVPQKLRHFQASWPGIVLHVVSSELVDVYDPRCWPPKQPKMAKVERQARKSRKAPSGRGYAGGLVRE